MRDARPLLTRLYELRDKVFQELHAAREVRESLYKSLKHSRVTEEDRTLYKVWIELVTNNIEIAYENLRVIDTKISDLKFTKEN